MQSINKLDKDNHDTTYDDDFYTGCNSNRSVTIESDVDNNENNSMPRSHSNFANQRINDRYSNQKQSMMKQSIKYSSNPKMSVS